MKNNATKSIDMAEKWRLARALHPLYTALVREFVVEVPACPDLEAGLESPPKE